MIFSLDILSNDNPLVTFLVCLIALIISVAIGISKEKKETEEYARRKGVTVEEIRELRTKRRERKIPKPVKTIVWNRDGGCCRYCGSSINIEYDHIYPFSKGGSSADIDNIQLLCRDCNAEKSNRVHLDAVIPKEKDN